MPALITVRCPAKLNLALSVGPIDPADPHRRHAIASLMVAINLCDTLTLSDAHEVTADNTRWTRRFADDAPQPQTIDWPLEEDLAYRAANRVAASRGDHDPPIHFALAKRIPSGAGLGGGSADAAGVLKALTDRDPDPPFDAAALAEQLGSDVAFALQATAQPGFPAALATGFGERLEPVALPATLHFALVLPPFSCPTAPVYREFDAHRPAPPPPDESRVRQCLHALNQSPDAFGQACFNDLTDAACAVQPPLQTLLATLRDAGLNPHVTGSGSAVFLVARDPDDATRRAEKAHDLTGFPSLPVRSL